MYIILTLINQCKFVVKWQKCNKRYVNVNPQLLELFILIYYLTDKFVNTRTSICTAVQIKN